MRKGGVRSTNQRRIYRVEIVIKKGTLANTQHQFVIELRQQR